MNILDKIVIDKRKEVDQKKKIVSVNQLENSDLFSKPCPSLKEAIRSSNTGIIAEFKRRSPSRDVINNKVDVGDVVSGYEAAGVCGVSVLTDRKYFGGSMEDVLLARSYIKTPILRKEFIIDEYQLIEAKSIGADVILLIAAVLTEEEIKNLSSVAKSLGLDVLLEIHNEEELNKSLVSTVDMIGVNNRNLKTFEVSTDTSKALATIIPDQYVKISESGISNVDTISDLRTYGYEGFLIGENFMKTDVPGESCKVFIKELESKVTTV